MVDMSEQRAITKTRPRRARRFASICIRFWTNSDLKTGWSLSNLLPSLSRGSDGLFSICLKFWINKLVGSGPNFCQTLKNNFDLFLAHSSTQTRWKMMICWVISCQAFLRAQTVFFRSAWSFGSINRLALVRIFCRTLKSFLVFLRDGKPDTVMIQHSDLVSVFQLWKT